MIVMQLLPDTAPSDSQMAALLSARPDHHEAEQDPFDAYVARYRATLDEVIRISRLNRQSRKLRSAVMQQNNARMRIGGEPLPMPPLEARLDPHHRGIQMDERRAMQALKRVTPAEWSSRCMALPMPVRAAVAFLVWWDFLSDTEVKDRSDAMDWCLTAEFYREAMRSGALKVPTAELARALHAVGYSPWRATERANGNAENFETKENT